MSRHEQMQQAFLEEAGDLLPELESALLELDERPEDSELINRVFRALHTIKGSGAMFGFEGVADFTHEVETVFDLVRNGEVRLSKDLLDLTFQAKDEIQSLLADPEAQSTPAMQSIVDELKKLVPAVEPGASSGQSEAINSRQSGEENVYRVRFKPATNIMATGTDPMALLDELRELGQTHVIAHSEDIPNLQDLDPEGCYIWWDVILTTDQGKNAIRDVFIFVEDDSELHIELLDEGTAGVGEEGYRKLGQILTERGDLDPADLKSVLDSQKRLGELLVQAGLVSSSQVQSALAEQEAVREVQEKRGADPAQSSVRVPAAKLDDLVNLVGELVIAQARLTQTVSGKEDQELRGIAEEIERLSDELRDSTLGIRMLPIGSSFAKFRRVVRDLSRQKEKDIELITEGADTELDKTVIERLNDPLVHLLRNSIDHGIEPPEERQAQGKPTQGQITFSARHSGGNVLITISDDGRGIDPEAVRAKAVAKGVISAEAELSDKELVNLIFEPGFSTSEEISDISGRGVGMDVVKQNISALRGNVDVESSKGAGSTIRVTLPLTLAIIEGLQVRVQEEHYILPLAAVNECIELNGQESKGTNGGRFVRLRDQLVPYIKLRDWFKLGGSRPEIEQVVIASTDNQLVGLVVDEVIGQQQTVIKNLGRVYKDVHEISGATIKGDGSIALILDIDPLVREVSSSEAAVAHVGGNA
jgi:two-component system chemotaxis sensor kinase CheA